MKLVLTLLFLCQLAYGSDWRDTAIVYWLNDNPNVAVSPTDLHGIDHASGSVTGALIGDFTGPLSSYCTTFVNCPTSIPNCQWNRDHKNLYLDTYLFVTCRPLTNGITYIGTNYYAGQSVWWWSKARTNWVTDCVIGSVSGEHLETFADTTTAWFGFVALTGTQAISGDSGSPVYTTNGDFICSMQGHELSDMVTSYGRFLYPLTASYRPVNTNTITGSMLLPYFSPP